MSTLLATALATMIHGEPRYIMWTVPTEREPIEGQTEDLLLAPEEIKEYAIEWVCDASGEGAITATGTATSVPVPTDMLGQCLVSVRTIDTGGRQSETSGLLQLYIKLPPPTRGGFE